MVLSPISAWAALNATRGPIFGREQSSSMPSDGALMVPAKALAVVGFLGVAGGFTAGFAAAESLYATEGQKKSVRQMAMFGTGAVLATAVAGAVLVLRARMD